MHHHLVYWSTHLNSSWFTNLDFPSFFMNSMWNHLFPLNYLFVSEIHPVATSRLVTLRPSLFHIIPPSFQVPSTGAPCQQGSSTTSKWPPALPARQPVDLGFTDSTKGELRWREVDDWYPQGSKKVDRNNTKTYDEKEWNCLGYSTFGRVRDKGWGRKPK